MVIVWRHWTRDTGLKRLAFAENGRQTSRSSEEMIIEPPNIQARFDSFQEPAVANVVSDFTNKLRGRYLLVIPTGGGKTFTAVKAVNRLFERETLNST